MRVGEGIGRRPDFRGQVRKPSARSLPGRAISANMERETKPMASSHNRSRAAARLRIVIPLLVVAAGIWAGIVYLRNDRANPDVLTASGTIEASQVSAASKFPGRILRLHAAEGDVVRAGTPLVTIAGRGLLAAGRQGRAAVGAARARP